MNILSYSQVNIINLIIVSIIPFLIWGPFFPDLIVSISTLFFLYYILKNNDFYYLKHKTFIHNKTLGHEMPQWQSYEIDTQLDLTIIRAIIESRKVKK